MSNNRRHTRMPANEKIQLFWIDEQGGYHREAALSYDRSPSGISILLKQRMDRDCYIAVRSGPDGRTTSARVRHITPSGMLFRTGLEFR